MIYKFYMKLIYREIYAKLFPLMSYHVFFIRGLCLARRVAQMKCNHSYPLIGDSSAHQHFLEINFRNCCVICYSAFHMFSKFQSLVFSAFILKQHLHFISLYDSPKIDLIWFNGNGSSPSSSPPSEQIIRSRTQIHIILLCKPYSGEILPARLRIDTEFVV